MEKIVKTLQLVLLSIILISTVIAVVIEIKDTTVNEWGCVPEYKQALEDQLGEGALNTFNQAAKDNMQSMNDYSRILYSNFRDKIISK